MKCEICSKNKFKTIFRFKKYKVVKCLSCNIQFNYTFKANKKFRKNMFEEDYYDLIQSKSFEKRLKNFNENPSVKIYLKYLKKIEKKIGIGKLLEVGSAFGTFLKVANDRSWDVNGVELSKYSSSKVKETWGFNVYNGDLEDYICKEKKFDLVAFWDVIEHVEFPKKNLKKVRKLLKDEGLLLLTTDSYSSLIAFLGKIIYFFSFGLIRGPAERFYIQYNSFYFTEKTMRELLKNVGFEIVYFEKIDYPVKNLNLTKIEKIIVNTIYSIGNILNWNSQFIIIAKKIK